MDFQASARTPRLNQKAQTLIILGAFLAASMSLTYAAVTTRGKSIDLRTFHEQASAWAEGNYNRTLRLNVYPPATVVLLSPLSVLSFDTLTVGWFIMNLVLTGLSVYLAIKLFGPQWPWWDKYFLLFFLMSWAPFRVTLRNGQLTMLIIALLLGSLLALRRHQPLLSGALLGLALCKYTLTFPFLFYFVWQQQWKVVLSAASLQATLTGVYAYRLGINLIEVVTGYLSFITQFSLSFSATADFNSLLLGLTGGHKPLAILLGLAAALVTFVSLILVFRRRPEAENAHLALLSLFALWSVYHRTYDFMLCMIPVAVLIDFISKSRLLAFSYFWLAGFSLLALGLPGFVANRFSNETSSQGAPPLVFFLIQSERLLVMGMFCSLLWVLWKRADQRTSRFIAVDQPVGKLA